MIEEKVRRLLILASAANVSTTELRTALMEIQRRDAAEILEEYTRIRRGIRQLGNPDQAEGPIVGEQFGDRHLQDELIYLLNQSGVPISSAIQILGEQLSLNNHVELPKYNSKQGVRRWILRVLERVEPNDALNAAIEVFANDHDRRHDQWRLSDS